MKKPIEPSRAAFEDVVVSLVVPVFNERMMLPLFFERVLSVLKQLSLRWEIVFVDDGSKDGSSQYIQEVIANEKRIRLVRLSRNFGKEAAVTAGLEQTRGKAIIVLDADLQDPPEYIPAMIESWQSGVEVVLMQRRSRAGESCLKRWSAHIYYRLLNLTSQTDIPVDTGDFRLMSRKAVDALLTLKERNRYMKGLFAWVGMSTAIIRYDRAPRAAGETKWDYPALIGLALEGLTSFSISPLRWAIGMGLLAASLGVIFGLWIVIKTLLLGEVTSGYPSLIAMVSFLGGVQLLSVGILGEYVGKTYMEAKQRPIYVIEEIVENLKKVEQEINYELVESSYVKTV
ncbi:MAG TPA: glycosyltransferase family 2 protein [Alcaligenaceae bacterium]|nr:glycosyltransferase family 2 protein [Alcaligenaceae bacterium]